MLFRSTNLPVRAFAPRVTDPPGKLRVAWGRGCAKLLFCMNADRAKLATELDSSEARAERLEEANKEVSRRLVTAMETIRAVLDR